VRTARPDIENAQYLGLSHGLTSKASKDGLWRTNGFSGRAQPIPAIAGARHAQSFFLAQQQGIKINVYSGYKAHDKLAAMSRRWYLSSTPRRSQSHLSPRPRPAVAAKRNWPWKNACSSLTGRNIKDCAATGMPISSWTVAFGGFSFYRIW
jgi:hypothetical protein